MTVSYRQGTIEDFREVFALVKAFVDGSPRYAGREVDYGWLETKVLHALNATAQHVFLVGVVNDKPVGVLWASVGEDFAERTTILMDQMAYVLPLYRGQGVLSTLLNCLEQFAFDYLHVKEIRLITFAGADNDRMDTGLRKRGYDRIGSILVKDNK